MLMIIAGGLALLMCFVFLWTGKPVRSLLSSVFGGAAAFFLLNLASGLTGVALSLNLFSAASALFLGAPGICSLWILQFFWR